MENIYKNNLLLLSKLTQIESIYYCDNQILKEDRYFSTMRCGNNIDKILSIITTSFFHYCNLILISKDNEFISKIMELLTKSIYGLKQFEIYNKNNEVDTTKILNQIKVLENHFEEIENNLLKNEELEEVKETIIENKFNINQNLFDEMPIEQLFEKEEEEENNYGLLGKIIYGLSTIVISIYNHIFVY